MNPVKIIFFDIDGTLIDLQRKAITDTMLSTLIRLKQKGYLLCLATGRGPSSLPHLAPGGNPSHGDWPLRPAVPQHPLVHNSWD